MASTLDSDALKSRRKLCNRRTIASVCLELLDHQAVLPAHRHTHTITVTHSCAHTRGTQTRRFGFSQTRAGRLTDRYYKPARSRSKFARTRKQTASMHVRVCVCLCVCVKRCI